MDDAGTTLNALAEPSHAQDSVLEDQQQPALSIGASPALKSSDALLAEEATHQKDMFDPPDADLPPLPLSSSQEDLSLADLPLEPPSESISTKEDSRLDSEDASNSALIDNNMRRKLMDMESSFLPELSLGPRDSIAGAYGKGPDDTYLFGGSPGLLKDAEPAGGSDQSAWHADSGLEPPTPASAYQTPHPGHSSDNSRDDDVTTSPAAAAAKRAESRTAAMEGLGHQQPLSNTTNRSRKSEDHVFKKPDAPSRSSSRSTLKQAPLSSSQEESENMSNTSSTLSKGTASDNSSSLLHGPSKSASSTSLLKRPSFLHSRQASARSSISSFTARSDVSDATVGADYALQSGGAQPTESHHRPDIYLSRLPSLGSVASGLSSSHSEAQPSWTQTRSSTELAGGKADNSGLEQLDEESMAGDSAPITPRALRRSNYAPTDTVIAQHIRNIEVPETIAREYMEKFQHESPEKRQALGLTFGRKNNLTLKEQNSKIDKLSKENFDLKLKIHFLDQALQNRSDEGVKEMISKNVQLQTDLANEKKENQGLRRKIRELERKVKQQEEGMQEQKPAVDALDDDKSERSAIMAEMEEEIFMMREIIQQHESEIEKLREENLTKEVDKRRLAEYVKTMGETKQSSEPATGVEEAMEMWRDLLEAETARREQADEDAAKLREEINLLKAELASTTGYNYIRNIYNVSKRQQISYATHSEAGQPETMSEANGSVSNKSSTLVSQNEALRHENAELRRDLSAQTQMLTSRNRERERLQQEIEELKLHHRRGGADGVRSVAGDSIFERSVSRAGAHNRSSSRASGATRVTQISDQERDGYEKKLASLRDEMAQIKMVNQDLERELNAHLDILQTAEAEIRGLKEEKDLTEQDLQALQRERDDALLNVQEKEEEFEALREEAIAEIEALERDLDQKEADFTALQAELKTVSESVVRLEDELQASQRKEKTLEQQLQDNENELEALDKKLRDTIEKNERLDVQLESSQGEVAFLREEQDADKLKIGELESALGSAQASLQDTKELIREMEEQYAEEKRQREVLDDQEKHQTQQLLDDLNTQLAKAKDEVRKLRKNLAGKEQEAASWKERLETLEANLKEALGDVYDTKSSILKDVVRLTHEFANTHTELSHVKQELSEKDRLLRNRDSLLESTAHETRKLADLLEKERAARQKDRVHFDQITRSQQSLTKTIKENDTRAMEIESQRNIDRKRYAEREQQYREQLYARNNLLLSVWSRLSTVCGKEFVQKYGLVLPEQQLPSIEIIARNLAGFTRNMNLAVKSVESLVSNFNARVKEVERNLWNDFQTLEHAMDVRTKRIDHLEKMVSEQEAALERAAAAANLTGTAQPPGTMPVNPRSSSRNSNKSQTSEVTKLKQENKLLKAELNLHRAASPTRGLPPGGRGHAPRSSIEAAVSAMPLPGNDALSPSRQRELRSRKGEPRLNRTGMSATLLRHHSASAADTLSYQSQLQHGPASYFNQRAESPTHRPPQPPTLIPPPPVAPQAAISGSSAPGNNPLQPSEQRWIHRLKELERRLKAEREARLLDRSDARKRLEMGIHERDELRRQLEMERELRSAEGSGEHEMVEDEGKSLVGDADGGLVMAGAPPE